MTDGVLYLSMGQKHAIHLIVSVCSLREHYQGPVAIVTDTGEGLDVAARIADDASLGPVLLIPRPEMRAGGHGVSYLCKTWLPPISPFDRTIYLDADTVVVGDISPLWPDLESGETILTQFADWVSTGGKMRQRILGWQEAEPERVRRMLRCDYPAINTGVVAWSRNSTAFAKDWAETGARRVSWIGDEIAAQLIFPDHRVRVFDDRFNASVVFAPYGMSVETRKDVRVAHGHGNKFWKRPSGQSIYMPHYLRFLEADRCGLRSMRPSDKCLKFLPAETRQKIEGMLT